MMELTPGAGIGDEQVVQSQPFVRALAVQRLEMIWRTCEPHVNVPLDEDGHPLYKADPRFVEAAIRVLDRLARWYRLDHPQVGGNDPDPGSLVDQRELARKQIRELTARMGPPAA